jgi:hypothetical protein
LLYADKSVLLNRNAFTLHQARSKRLFIGQRYQLITKQLYTDLSVGTVTPDQPTGCALNLALSQIVDPALAGFVTAGRRSLTPLSRLPCRIPGRPVVSGYSPRLLFPWLDR